MEQSKMICTSFTCKVIPGESDYCPHCSHALYPGVVVANGKKYLFEFNRQFGPTFIGKRGEPSVCQPGSRHPVWKEFEKWLAEWKKEQGL